MPQHRTSKGKAFRAPLACALLAMLLAACGGKAPADNPNKPEPDLTILHVNDSHSFVAGMNDEENYCIDDAECRGGYARIAAEIRRVKAGRNNVLALHAGDSFQGTLLFSVRRWPMLAELDALLPYDAMTPGNHEYDDGCAEFAGYIPKLPYPMLAANIDAQPGSDLDGLGIEPYMIREIGGRKVGVIGLSNDSGAILASACPGMTFTDHEADLKRAVRELRDRGIDRIIALTHLGLPEGRRLARSVDGVDVIVGGHSHSYIGPGSEEGPYPIVEHSPNGDPVLVVTAGYGTRWLGELSVNFDENGAPASWSGEAVPLGRDMPRDPAIAAKTAEYGEALETLRKTVAGSATTYSFGDEAGQLTDFAWYGEDGESGSTHTVGIKRPNAWDLYDMHGNVWEWTADRFGADYYARSQETANPGGPETGGTRVIRGGAWNSVAGSCRSAARGDAQPDERNDSFGFRLALGPEQ